MASYYLISPHVFLYFFCQQLRIKVDDSDGDFCQTISSTIEVRIPSSMVPSTALVQHPAKSCNIRRGVCKAASQLKDGVFSENG